MMRCIIDLLGVALPFVLIFITGRLTRDIPDEVLGQLRQPWETLPRTRSHVGDIG